MFLLNSRLGRFSAAHFGSLREEAHLPWAPLLPKLRGHFAEFLDRDSLERLRLLASPTCVGLRYGHPPDSHARLFSAVGSRPLCEVRNLFGIGSRLRGGICLTPSAYSLASGLPSPDGPFAPASPLVLDHQTCGAGIFTRFPSTTPLGLALGTG